VVSTVYGFFVAIFALSSWVIVVSLLLFVPSPSRPYVRLTRLDLRARARGEIKFRKSMRKKSTLELAAHNTSEQVTLSLITANTFNMIYSRAAVAAACVCIAVVVAAAEGHDGAQQPVSDDFQLHCGRKKRQIALFSFI